MKKELFALKNTKHPKTIEKKNNKQICLCMFIVMFRLVTILEKYKYWQGNSIKIKYA